jgi:hypothetical protein
MRYGQKKIPLVLSVSVFIYLCYCLVYTPNFILTIPVVLFPLLAFRLFWIDNHPNVLFWGVMLQWLSASTQLLYSNFLGVTLAERMKEYSFPASKMEMATLLSIVGLFAFSLGLFVAVRRLRFSTIDSLLDSYSPKNIFMAYISSSLLVYLTTNLIWVLGGFVQYVYLFFYIKWGFFMVAFYVIHKRAPFLKWYFYGFVVLEIFLGLNSFFAREILLIAMFSFLAAVQVQSKLNAKFYIIVIVGLLLLVNYLVIWSAIKGDYRKYVSKGKFTQSVLVSKEDARSKYFTLITNVNEKQYQEGIEQFVNRLGYIQFFAACLDYVPRKVPHQDGRVYLSALQHYFVPRFLNPDKEVLDDSKHTSEFTGLRLSGAKKATSFSLGYIADAYVDFGYFYMFPLLCAFGWLFGFSYRYLKQRSSNELWAWILTSPFILLLNINGADTKKALGGLLIYFLTVAILRKFLIKAVDPFLRVRR